ncbi:MAG: hypothetical protein L6Q95_14530 [Planctomycetes bacterium]|nr:hypothetical protein [Planctomycetota bacterium]
MTGLAWRVIGGCVLLAVATFADGGDKGQEHVRFSGRESADEGDTACCAVGSASEWRAEAHLISGSTGADVRCGGERDQGHVDFRIAIEPDGGVDVNGLEIATCDPAAGCRLSLAWSSGSGTLVVTVEQADGSLAAGQYYLAAAPAELSVQAAEILSLAVTPP